MIYLIAFLVVISIWIVWGLTTSRAEQTEYTVLIYGHRYEIRLYPEHIVAQTVVRGAYEDALNQGFRILAKYIFGDNVKKERIAMTSPVVEQSVGESIAMTAPVMASIDGDIHTITFGMPRTYSRETVPTPNDPRVTIVTIPEKRMAAIRFTWFRTRARILLKRKQLLDALSKDNVVTRGEFQYAGYNAPWTPPWMIRNEVMIEIE